LRREHDERIRRQQEMAGDWMKMSEEHHRKMIEQQRMAQFEVERTYRDFTNNLQVMNMQKAVEAQRQAEEVAIAAAAAAAEEEEEEEEEIDYEAIERERREKERRAEQERLEREEKIKKELYAKMSYKVHEVLDQEMHKLAKQMSSQTNLLKDQMLTLKVSCLVQ
jgi:hypothetical protein